MKRTLQILLWLGFYLRSIAEDVPSLQIRIPLHVQYQNIRSNEWKMGIAAWMLFPDVVAKGNKTTTLNLYGPMWNYDKHGSWVELLGGFRANKNGYIDPIVDLRILDRSLPRVNVFGEIGYFPQTELRRVYASIGAETPVSLENYKLRLGVESEDIISFSGKKDSLGIGPRVSFPIPLEKYILGLSSSVTIAYQFRNDRDFLRCYLGFTYVIGKK